MSNVGYCSTLLLLYAVKKKHKKIKNKIQRVKSHTNLKYNENGYLENGMKEIFHLYILFVFLILFLLVSPLTTLFVFLF